MHDRKQGSLKPTEHHAFTHNVYHDETLQELTTTQTG
jgi:hypothetical protein